MVLAVSDGTWTFGLCSICILHNTILATFTSSSTEKSKEPLFLGNNIFRKNYNFEDFFWTGSGGGPMLEDLFRNDTDPNLAIVEASPSETWRTTTVFHTTTILFATVYPNVKGCGEYDCTPRIKPVQTGSIDFSITAHVPDIRPTSTVLQSTTTESTDSSFDKKEIEGTTTRSETSTFFLSPKNSTTEQISPSGPESPKIDVKVKSNATTPTVFPETVHDQKHWLLTIFKDDNYLPNIEVNSTEKKLSNLYREAFGRREKKFLTENDYGGRKEGKMSEDVNAHIVNVTRMGNGIGIIYFVTVNGNPVPAIAAAEDLRLMTASEVMAELGRPILTKADPYVKVTVPLGARVKGKARDTWLLIGCVVAAIFLLVLLLGLFALLLSKNHKKKNAKDPEEEGGKNNLGFEEEIDPKIKNLTKDTQRKSRLKSKDSKPGNETATGSTVKFKEEVRRQSFSSSSCSGSSDAGLVRFRQMKKDRNWEDGKEKPKPKPRTRGRKIQSSDCRINNERTRVRSSGSAISRNTFDCSATEECTPRLTRSPTSYLSMPSVKAFPRGTKIPDPLNKVLEPTSIRHLDADSDSSREYSRQIQNRQVEVEVEESRQVKTKSVREKGMTRHGSLEGDDPGFIGPIVWNRHRQKILERDAEVSNEEEYEENVSVGKMRRRFNELLDDALNMFESRTGSPVENEMLPARQIDNRVHSAVLRPSELNVEPTSACRPNTTGSKRHNSSAVSGPKGAWKTPSCSTIGKSVGSDFLQGNSPSIDKNLIFVNSELSPGDPAIPLIAAIKKELKKFDGSRERSENLN